MKTNTILRNLRGLPKRPRRIKLGYVALWGVLIALASYCLHGAITDALAQQAEFEWVNRWTT